MERGAHSGENIGANGHHRALRQPAQRDLQLRRNVFLICAANMLFSIVFCAVSLSFKCPVYADVSVKWSKRTLSVDFRKKVICRYGV